MPLSFLHPSFAGLDVIPVTLLRLMHEPAEPRWESISLLSHWRIFLAVFFNFWFAGAAFAFRYTVKDSRDVIATAPPGCLLCFKNLYYRFGERDKGTAYCKY